MHAYSYRRAGTVSRSQELFNKGKAILEKKCFFLKYIFLPSTNSNILQHICMDLEVTEGCHCTHKLVTVALLC